MVEYEETSSLQVLGTVTADAIITVFFGLFSFDGSIHDALFPKGLFTTQLAAAATLLDVLAMLVVRATLAASAVTGTRQCTSRYGLIVVFSLHCSMAIWCGTAPISGHGLSGSRQLTSVHLLTCTCPTLFTVACPLRVNA
jgi:hypothetical protein